MILIDRREPDWIKESKFKEHMVLVTELSAGDLHVLCDNGDLLAFERKTGTDFLNSLRDNRLFEQLARLKALTRYAYLCITGDLSFGRDYGDGVTVADGRATGWSFRAVQGALLTIQELGVYIVYSDPSEFAATILCVADRSRRDVIEIMPQAAPKILGPEVCFFAAIPGIGPELADKVLAHCGTVAWGLSGLTDDSVKIPGIGPGKRKQVREFFSLEDDQEFTIITGESE